MAYSLTINNMATQNWEAKYRYALKQKSFAWAKYYTGVNGHLTADYGTYNHYKEIIKVVSLDEFVKKQIVEMSKELKKKWSCPICLDFIEPDDLDITPCGHYYCKGCLAHLKQTTTTDKVNCAVCRKTMSKD